SRGPQGRSLGYPGGGRKPENTQKVRGGQSYSGPSLEPPVSRSSFRFNWFADQASLGGCNETLLACRPPSVDRHNKACDMRGPFRAQKDDHLSDLFRFAPSTLRNCRQDRRFGVRGELPTLSQGCTHQPWSDCVHSNSLRRVLEGR